VILEAPSGLALLRKPEGITSFQALSPVKRSLSSGRLGHAGTLDRFASGLLVILVGSYSRLASYVVAGEKHYRGLISFGVETETLDPEGAVKARAAPPTLAALEAVLPSFRGKIRQVPPAYSAVHVGGKRAYELARSGGEPELRERSVEIHSLELLSYEADGAGGRAWIDVRCSSGTYIRSLARDLAEACGSKAHLAALERLAIGPFLVEDAVGPRDFDPTRDLRLLDPKSARSLGLLALTLRDDALVASFLNGGRLAPAVFEPLDGGEGGALADSEDPDAAVFGPRGELLGVIHLEAEGAKYKVVMPGRAP
jgi:tRNA pseudouridine55 synthase